MLTTAQGERYEVDYTSQETLKVIFTPEENQAHAQGLARIYPEVERLESERKSMAGDFKSRIDGKRAEASRLSGWVANGYGFREVPVEVRKNYDRGQVEKFRLDTGEVYESRAMTATELQAGLFDMDRDGHDDEPAAPEQALAEGTELSSPAPAHAPTPAAPAAPPGEPGEVIDAEFPPQADPDLEEHELYQVCTTCTRRHAPWNLDACAKWLKIEEWKAATEAESAGETEAGGEV